MTECVHGNAECVAVGGAETFVDEQRYERQKASIVCALYFPLLHFIFAAL
jgi:hypothetical protein